MTLGSMSALIERAASQAITVATYCLKSRSEAWKTNELHKNRNAFGDIIRFTVRNISRGLMLVEPTSITSSPSASARQTAVMNS